MFECSGFQAARPNESRLNAVDIIQHGSDPALLWLWRRLAATALIIPLSWEPPYAMGAALEKTKRQKKKKERKKERKKKIPRLGVELEL